jgi:hypothetical protein
MKERSKQYLGLLFELKISLNEKNSIVIDYGGKPVGKIREALRVYHTMVISVQQ